MENEEKLNALDRNSGDGDTGTTFARAAKGMYTLYLYVLPMLFIHNTFSHFAKVINTLHTYNAGNGIAIN